MDLDVLQHALRLLLTSETPIRRQYHTYRCHCRDIAQIDECFVCWAKEKAIADVVAPMQHTDGLNAQAAGSSERGHLLKGLSVNKQSQNKSADLVGVHSLV
jgi:hypothetical protein